MFLKLLARLIARLRHRDLDSEVDAELAFHLEMQTQANIDRGMAPEPARRAALIALGGLDQTKESVRDARWTGLDSTWQDVRHAFRTLRHSPGFAATAIITLALGIGATTAVFSVVAAALYPRLPVEAPNELVNIYRDSGHGGFPDATVSYPDYLDVRDRTRVFTGVIGYSYFIGPVSANGSSEMVIGEAITSSYCPVLRLSPPLGRVISPEEEHSGQAVALISDRLWRTAFAGDTQALGRTLRLSNRPFSIIGVMPPGFRGVWQPSILPTDVWVPLDQGASPVVGQPLRLDDRDQCRLLLKARLRQGVSLEQAHAATSRLAAELDAAYRPPGQFGARRRFGLRPTTRRYVMIDRSEASIDDPPESIGEPFARCASVAPGYFRSIGLAVTVGRDFQDLNRSTAPPVAIVSETLARRFWPHGNAIGAHVNVYGNNRRSAEVVGVVRDTGAGAVGPRALRERPWIYFPLSQQYSSGAYLVARSYGDPGSLLEPLRRLARDVDPNVAPAETVTLRQVIRNNFYVVRAGAALMGAFGVVGLVLAMVGLYGVTAYVVSRRTRELGVRAALGADSGMIQRMVLREGMALVAAGVVLGIALALGTARIISSMLFGVGAYDPVTFVAAPSLLILTALVACYLPARRAARVSPITALRSL